MFDHDSSLNSVEEQQDPGPDGQQRDSGGPTWWQRDLRELWSDWGPNAWPFLNADEFIKVEEFVHAPSSVDIVW